MSLRIGYFLTFALVLLTFGQAAWSWSAMPERMASHFNAAGQPDAWISRNAFFSLFLGLQIFMAALLLGLGRFGRLLPESLINLPHKEYWLAPERREGTFRRVESCMVWIAVATAALLSWILQLTLNANQQQQPLDSKAAIMATGLYLLFVGVWCVVYFYPKGRLP